MATHSPTLPAPARSAAATRSPARSAPTAELACWGYNANGQLGDGTTGDKSVPVCVNGAGPNLWSAAAITGGLVNDGTGSHTCAVTTAKQVKCWGWGGPGADGQQHDHRLQPAPVQTTLSTAEGASPVAATSVANGSPIAGGNAGTCVVVNTGLDHRRRAVLGPQQQRRARQQLEHRPENVPVAVLAGAGPSTNVGGTNYLSGRHRHRHRPGRRQRARRNPAHACALANGGVFCWGYNKDGELGNGTTNTGVNALPVQVIAPGRVSPIAVGNSNNCALFGADGTSKCWGWNGYGQLASRRPAARRTPTSTARRHMTSISMGSFHQCVTVTSGAVYCSGRNDNGEARQQHHHVPTPGSCR